ncbi:metaxin-1 isoform X2 [Microplitis demolitor]|uniref:metaxin-1 isoform X2 n=1 Tax=Microplitis demolitor TaxID=69319 RepID=UPI0004CDCEA5|nr:metaxin-1 isoform X2 [Microplitis demolitor]
MYIYKYILGYLLNVYCCFDAFDKLLKFFNYIFTYIKLYIIFVIVNVKKLFCCYFIKMNSTETYQLDVWKGDWGLPSVGIRCLQILAYAKFSNAPIRINSTCNPFRTPNGHLPVLRSGSNAIDSVHNIIQFLKDRNYSPDNLLSAKERADIVSYEYMLRENFYPALQYVWWLDQKNFNDLIRPWYAKAIPFPFNFYYPSQYEKHARATMETLFMNEDDMTVIENKVYSEAQKCITLLSTRLGDSDYFFGTSPTSLDALVYSYLAPLLKAPLPNPALQNHLKACTNLTKFVSRISQRYFEYDYLEYEKIQARENEKKHKVEVDNEFPNNKRDKILAGVFVTFAMISYAFITGIVEVLLLLIRRKKFIRIPKKIKIRTDK